MFGRQRGWSRRSDIGHRDSFAAEDRSAAQPDSRIQRSVRAHRLSCLRPTDSERVLEEPESARFSLVSSYSTCHLNTVVQTYDSKACSIYSACSNQNTASVAHSAIFEITAASMQDTGVYTCVAANAAGKVEEQVQLMVSRPSGPAPPPSANGVATTFVPSLPPDSEIAFPSGSRAVLRCETGTTGVVGKEFSSLLISR